ncbi:MAG: hypothetical protein JRN46_02270 [Nitrososphaerota archaeon]|nr:hypothetical protein [Nitrososphaerota archaeon]
MSAAPSALLGGSDGSVRGGPSGTGSGVGSVRKPDGIGETASAGARMATTAPKAIRRIASLRKSEETANGFAEA